jgi:hypothetical protein
MTEKPAQSKELLFVGLFAIAMGIIPMLMVTGAFSTEGLHAPLWVGGLAGGVFILAGLALVLRWFAGGDPNDGEMPKSAPLWLRAVHYLMGLACIGALAAIGTWVAFGPGERAFSMSVPFLGGGPANQWLGRTVFGFGALLTWGFFLLAAVSWWRKLRASAPSS